MAVGADIGRILPRSVRLCEQLSHGLRGVIVRATLRLEPREQLPQRGQSPSQVLRGIRALCHALNMCADR